MGEARAEVGSVYIELLLARNVHVLATGTVDLHARCRQVLRHTNRKDILSLAEDARAVSKLAQYILLLHHGESPWRENEPSVDEPIKVHGRLIDFEELLVIQVLRVRAIHTQDHRHRVAEKLHSLPEPVQVEIISNVVFVDLFV